MDTSVLLYEVRWLAFHLGLADMAGRRRHTVPKDGAGAERIKIRAVALACRVLTSDGDAVGWRRCVPL